MHKDEYSPICRIIDQIRAAKSNIKHYKKLGYRHSPGFKNEAEFEKEVKQEIEIKIKEIATLEDNFRECLQQF